MTFITVFTNLQIRRQFTICICVCALFAVDIFPQNSVDYSELSKKLNSGTIEEKRDALYFVRNIGTEEASKIAIVALEDSSEIVRATAVASVIFLEKNDASHHLNPLLNDPSIYVRRETAYALGKVRSLLSVVPLIKALQNDKDLEVRSAAAIALGQIGDHSAVNALTEIITKNQKSSQTFLRRSAALSIGQIARNSQFLEYAKTDSKFVFVNANWEAKNSTYYDLTQLPEFKLASEVLIKMLQNKKESNDAKREAVFALGEIADSRALGVLQQNMNSEDELLAATSNKSISKILDSKIEPKN